VFYTPSLAIVLTQCNKLDSNLTNLEATVQFHNTSTLRHWHKQEHNKDQIDISSLTSQSINLC